MLIYLSGRLLVATAHNGRALAVHNTKEIKYITNNINNKGKEMQQIR
jgi:hypothetical protein